MLVGTPMKINTEPKNGGVGRWVFLFKHVIFRFHVNFSVNFQGVVVVVFLSFTSSEFRNNKEPLVFFSNT